MTSELPLKIRVDIRDLWNNVQSPLQQSVASLAETLGHKIVPQVKWPTLWGNLKKDFSDPETFVPGIVAYTTAWYEQLNWRLENDAFAEWTETLLSVLSKTSTGAEITLEIQVQSSPSVSVPRTVWSDASNSFHLFIPHGPVSSSSIASYLEQELGQLFIPANSDGKELDEEGWADVGGEPRLSAGSVPLSAARGSKPGNDLSPPRTLPAITSLTRPSDLLQATTPYILIIETGNPLLVQCSHQKSLEVLAQYLNKWGKINKNDGQRRNIFAVDLVESDFAVGVNDLLRIEPRVSYGRTGPINPTIVLAFIEGILGYKFMHASSNRFVYRLDDVLR
ncbi:hypothetical protein D9611_010469 [Ephemerocybe angulata]|uniref:Uncharacterized protein n=1 Tax=Ephemerocybe angulata TaxID=980116 RepID=A0A8H5FAX9_9AGAR|nr:hypothetical protein D9611_010469 [Tulosesus angulatus]